MHQHVTGTAPKILVTPPENPVVTSIQSPDIGAPTLTVVSAKESFDSHKCEIEKVSSGVVVSSNLKTAKIPDDPKEFSAGDPHGTGKNIGKITLCSKPMVNSSGVLNDMWEAFNYIKNNYSNEIESVDWLKSDYSYSTDNNLEVIELPDPDALSVADPLSVKQWLYLDSGFTRDIHSFKKSSFLIGDFISEINLFSSFLVFLFLHFLMCSIFSSVKYRLLIKLMKPVIADCCPGF